MHIYIYIKKTFLYIHIFTYIHIFICLHIYIYIYIYIIVVLTLDSFIVNLNAFMVNKINSFRFIRFKNTKLRGMLPFSGNDSADSPSLKNVQKEPPEMPGHSIPTVSACF